MTLGYVNYDAVSAYFKTILNLSNTCGNLHEERIKRIKVISYAVCTSAVLPIISIGQLVHWYRPIVIYTIGKYKFLFLLPKVNKHESGFRFQ